MKDDLKKTCDNTFIALQFFVMLICIPYIAWVSLCNPNWIWFFIGSMGLLTSTFMLIKGAYIYDAITS